MRLKELNPSYKVVVLMVILAVFMVLIAAITAGLLKALWGIDMMEDPFILSKSGETNYINAARIATVIQQIGFWAIPALLFIYLNKGDIKNNLPLKKNTLLQIGLLVVMALSMQAPVNFFKEINASMASNPDTIQSWSEQNIRNAGIVNTMMGAWSGMDFLIMIFILAVLPAVCEELLFRGALQSVFAEAFRNRHLAIWISAAIFSYMHMEMSGFIPRFLLGALLGYVMWWTGSIWSNILLHFLNNALAVLLLFGTHHGWLDAGWNSFGSSIETAIPLVLSFLILAGSMFLIGKKGFSN
jgi:membrane protease YdiL (CAAX protease family)